MTENTSYYFARLNLISYSPNLFSDGFNKAQLLTDALTNASPIDLYGFRWAFFSVEQIGLNNSTYLTGILVKFKPEDTKVVVSDDQQSLTKAPNNNEVTAQSRFFLQISSGLLIYSVITPKLSRTVVTARFLDLFHGSVGDQAKAEISAIDDQHRVVDEYQTFTAISKIKIDLVPSNPNFTDMWKDVDVQLKEWGLSKLKEEYIVKEGANGDSLKSSSTIKAKIAMAEDGYGQATVYGTKDGKSIKISTQDAPVFTKVWEGEEETPSGILNKLKDKIDSILARFV